MIQGYSRRRIGLIAWAAFACASSALADVTDYPLRLVVKTEAGERYLIARNDGPAPVSLRVTHGEEDAGRNEALPVTAIIPPGASEELGSIGEGERSVDYTYYPGRIDARTDATPCYRLPFADGGSFLITQAYGDPLSSHDNVQNRYAVDFAMPQGTPVVASRSGVVVDVTLRYEGHGTDQAYLYKSNRITIVHDDGTLAKYAHLAPRVALVKRGQRILAGTLIGYSGNTGYSTAPHLHFVVSRPQIVDGRIRPVAIPFRFCAGNGSTAFVPRRGMLAAASHGGLGVVATSSHLSEASR